MKNCLFTLLFGFALSMGACSSPHLAPHSALITPTPVPSNPAETMKKPYLILVSIDGYRPDYTRRFSPPNLLKIQREGASAKSMIPVFPSKTFPNHLSLVTGRYAENHGIVANYFYDFSRPDGKKLYQLSDSKAVQDGTWYNAEPLWITAEEQGMRTACFFWPGSEAEIDGVRPTYYKAYDKHVANQERVQGVIDWLKLPPETRPHFITLYFSDVDDSGHKYGPDSPEVKEAVLSVDTQIGKLVEGLDALSLPVDLVIVSDHGMGKLDPKKYIYIDEMTDLKGVTVGDTGPQLVLYGGAIDQIYLDLKKREKHFKVYRRSEIPESYHLSHSPRAGDLLIVADYPYSVGIHDKRFHPPVATHGYDPDRYPLMHAAFYAKGPDILPKKIKSFRNVDLYPFMMKILGLRETHEVDGNEKTLLPLLKMRVKTKNE